MNLQRVFKPPLIQEWTALLRDKGLKGFAREKGWKIVAAIFLFYLVRDSVIYLIIPLLIAQGFICR